MSTRHPQVRQGEQRRHLSSFLHQATKAHFGIIKLALDHPKCMLNLGANLSLGFLDLAYHFVQYAAFALFFVGAAPCCNLPDDLASHMFFAPLDTGIARISADLVFLTMQQSGDLRDVCNIGRSDHHAVHHPRLIVDPNVRFGAEVILVALLGLVHFRVALVILVIGQPGRMSQRGIDDGALSDKPRSPR